MTLAHRLFFASTLALWTLLPAVAHAQMNHGKHKAARAELGTSAALGFAGQVMGRDQRKHRRRGCRLCRPAVFAGHGKIMVARREGAIQPEPISADGENRPKLAFGTKGEIYVAYTKPLSKAYTGEIRFARSVDGGRIFSPHHGT